LIFAVPLQDVSRRTVNKTKTEKSVFFMSILYQK